MQRQILNFMNILSSFYIFQRPSRAMLLFCRVLSYQRYREVEIVVTELGMNFWHVFAVVSLIQTKTTLPSSFKKTQRRRCAKTKKNFSFRREWKLLCTSNTLSHTLTRWVGSGRGKCSFSRRQVFSRLNIRIYSDFLKYLVKISGTTDFNHSRLWEVIFHV